MLSSKPTHPILLAAATIAIGCTGEVTDGSDADTSSTHALLVVEQSAPVEDKQAVRSHASLWFLRIADERDFTAAASLVSARLELPPVGSCVAVGAAEDHVMPARISRVDLAFAGDVQVRTRDNSTPLTVRFFPNVADLVSGVMYTLQDQSDLVGPFEGWLSVTATGSGEFEPLDASTRPPVLPEGLTLNGTALPLTEVELQRGQPLSLGWNAGTEGDVIYVDIDPVPAVPAERVRCAFADTGLAEIPQVAVPESSEMGIAIHRSRDVALRSDRGEVGMAHFDLAVTSRVRLASP
jgi:hypothetical protein